MRAGDIFILEDDSKVRETLTLVLANAGYTPVCFADGDALLVAARQRYPTCILLDLVLPGKSGLEILHELHQKHYLAPVVMLSGHANIEVAVRAAKLGAIDFIEKPIRGNDLIRRLKAAIESKTRAQQFQSLAINPTSFLQRHPFTKREQEIIEQIIQGKSNKDIALLLKLSPRTVEDHRSNILKKANVKNSAQLFARILSPQEAPTPFLTGQTAITK